MSFVSGTTGSEAAQKLLEGLQSDFAKLAQETKKKNPQIKESCEEAIGKLKAAASNPQTTVYYVVNQIMYPLVQGCESKDVKLIKYCLGMMQRLITQQVVDQKGARYITDALWTLIGHGTEEVKVLQTVTLLLTTNSVVHGETLAKALVLCFRLCFTKDITITNTAGATVRQLVSLVFERVVLEAQEEEQDRVDSQNNAPRPEINLEELKLATAVAPRSLKPCAADAFLLFQDLVQLVNTDQPYWLIGMTEMTRTFGLELLETVLSQFSVVFYKNAEFSFLLKERVCALVIKLFSPNIKYRTVTAATNQMAAAAAAATQHEKPYFPLSMRLLRVVSILVQKYHSLLVTECEIFLSLIVKFLDHEKPAWQRSLALEVLHKMTVQPDLLVSFCKCYDQKDHATNIFQDIINSLGTYVQSLFVMGAQMSPTGNGGNNNNTGPVAPPPLATVQQGGAAALLANSGTGGGGGVSPQPGFYFRGVWLPLTNTFPMGQHKAIYLDMLEKMEPPPIPDGHGISVAYACLLDIVRSISLAIQGPSVLGESNPHPYKDMVSDEDKELHCQLINSSWVGLLTALSPLVDAATEESVTENLLKAMQDYAALCGLLELQIPRDAFITAICKSSLPPHYALSVLNNANNNNTIGQLLLMKGGNGGGGGGNGGHNRAGSQDMNAPYGLDNEFRQVVAVGTPLPTSGPVQSPTGPVMLTAKNLQCMRTLLNLSHCHGSLLGSAWQIVLATLQHLVWILGLKPSTGGSLQAVPSKPSQDINAVLTTAVLADLPVLSQMLSQLFEASQYLDDVALHHLIEALCKLSHEAMELAYSNREPSLFAVAKLLETGVVNLSRIEVVWRPLTKHLLEVCQHPHIRMREWGVEAITYLVRTALQYKYETPLRENERLQTLLLSPLAELSDVPHCDVRQRQLECVLQVLNSAGETFSHGWPLVLGIIGAVSDHHGETLIRIAFQCLQLVVTDFLPVMPWRCLPLCVNTTARFGFQTQELNISLTAIGLMWNISDYFNQHQEKLSASSQVGSEQEASVLLPDFPGTTNMPQFDRLWMCLYARLGDLCVDTRPAVRKSAGQTLFSTITAHGGLLQPPTWQAILWQVLFPVLDKVRHCSGIASNEKVDTSGNILIHHSRNTAQKQWAETQVLTLSGVAKVFNSKRELLQQLGDFPRAWSLLLEFIETAALSKSNEVSLAALKSFQELLYNKPERFAAAAKTTTTTSGDGQVQQSWDVAWNVWLNIGLDRRSTKRPSVTANTVTANKPAEEEVYFPSQAFLAALVQIFPALFQQIKQRQFTREDLRQFCAVITRAVSIPVHQDATPYIMSVMSDASPLTPLHDGVLECLDMLQQEALDGSMGEMLPDIFHQLLTLSRLACEPPPMERFEGGVQSGGVRNGKHPRSGTVSGASAEWVSMNYIPFGEKALSVAVQLYQQTADVKTVIEGNIMHEMVRTLRVPLALKYQCPSASTWKLAINGLMGVLNTGLPVARKNPTQFEMAMWTDVAETLDQFLFPKSVCTVEDRGLDEIVLDEAIDCQIIELLRDEVLPFSAEIPQEFILNVVVLLNKGSIHSATTAKIGCDQEMKLREEFAKTCFDTLLQFSLLDDGDGAMKMPSAEGGEGGVAGRLAITALLHRFQEVLHKYNEDEKQSGKCPLPRYRLSEISFVLKAIATLIISMKKAPPSKVGKTAWNQLIELYPYLVDCTTTSSTEVLRSLREALLEYCDLLQPLVPVATDANVLAAAATTASATASLNGMSSSHC